MGAESLHLFRRAEGADQVTPKRSVRVIPELRAAHISRHAWDPAETVIYVSINPDVGTDEIPSYCLRTPVWKVPAAIRRLHPDVVETPEPLWLRALPLTLAAAASARWLRKRPQIVAYCIENNDTAELFTFKGISLERIVRVPLGLLVSRLYDKVVFGTPGARQTYKRLIDIDRIASRDFLELGSPMVPGTHATPSDVLFVGRLQKRKGVIELLEAWEGIEGRTDARLTIIGDGELAGVVSRWAAKRPDRRHVISHVSHAEMPAVYRRHRVLVAPSVRDGRWREQVGLPIKEALQYGLTVVTTSETGLAEWLEGNGHTVIEDIRNLGVAVLDVIAQSLPVDTVQDSLPRSDGRRQAHEWMRS
ncbi:MAG: hypothetical protein K0S70_1041 [Microbacterium sp.]|jgi:glycosyltransferase involved in cell wall biosynthesis|nr:hypothetical protein [Microbacterium sp.]